MSKLVFFDSTLRDGSHAIRHQFSAEIIKNYCDKIDEVGFYTVIVGHGNGLGASSLQVGLSALSDKAMLSVAREALHKTKLGAFMLPGFGTIKDDLAPALELGVELVCVASHCTEADVTKQHLEYVTGRGCEAYGVLMMYHMVSKEKLLEEALKMQDYGARGIIIMDSAGASTPVMVSETIRHLSENLQLPVGFHAHNNLGLGVANSLTAIEAGATIIVGTVRGLGAGVGNCQLEVLAALLQKMGIRTGLDLYKMLDVSEELVAKIMSKPQELDALGIVGGLAGVFSGFVPHVKKAAVRFKVDPRDILIELGKRKVVGGQEDMVTEVAMELSQRTKIDETGYQVGSLL